MLYISVCSSSSILSTRSNPSKLSPPLYNHKGFDRSYVNGLMAFPTFFNLSLNFAIRRSWSEHPSGASGKDSACQCRLGIRDASLIPGSGRSSGEGHGNPLHYSCLENPMDRGASRAPVHGVAKSPTWLSEDTIHFSSKLEFFLSLSVGYMVLSFLPTNAIGMNWRSVSA